ncbi:glycoside hydrolase family 13 protein [Roseivirga sp. BDSF3-8]|uniref:glycoside hydrolase family 13 protein n=1 Tax=Roseivirga sp. BDSF3-8 TaxID=3241598 RepID=UPI003531B809
MNRHTFILCLLISGSTMLAATGVLAQKPPQHLEPPYWWAGMEHDSLQLMVHAHNVAETVPAVDYPGVTLVNTVKSTNPNYIWLNLHLAEDVEPGRFDITFKKGRKKVYRYTYELKKREPGSAKRMGYSTKDVIYLITPDRFANGNADNDENSNLGDELNRDISLKRHGGDIQGVIDHLDYIDEMGFTAIWLNPILENRQPEYSYHGYSTTDFYEVDPRFGTNELYAGLAKEAAERDILLIKDVILNHIGSGHWWMSDLPDTNWLNFQDKYRITSHTREALQDPYGSEYDVRMHSQGWFVPTMPDMNQRNAQLATYLIQNNIWWTEFAGLGGIRVDTYSYPDKTFLTEWTRRMMQEYPNLNIVGEEWSLQPSIVSYWQRDKLTYDGYISYLPGLMDFPLQVAMIEGLREENGLSKLYQTLGKDKLYPHPEDLVVFADNHDMSRVFTQLDHDTAMFKQAMAYLLTTRGIPQVYYGTEILMGNPDSEDHGVIRSDFPGGWQGDRVNGFTGENLPEWRGEIQEFMAKLLNWRKTATAVHSGKMLHFAPEHGTYVYFRYNEEQKVMVILNKNRNSHSLDLKRFEELLGVGGEARDVISGRSYDLSGDSIDLPPREALILELKN